jgi:hypothetical protein
MTRLVLLLVVVLAGVLPARAQDPFQPTGVLLYGRSGGQIVCGGTQSPDMLSLLPTCNGTPDTSTGFLTGAQVQLTGANSTAYSAYAAKGAKSVSGTYVPLMLSDASTWTIGDGPSCVGVGTQDVSWCLAADNPSGCCTGYQTGSCGYCDGSAIPIACDADSDCESAVQYLSQWWHTIDYAADPNGNESFAAMTLVPRITVSGGGTRALGHQAFLDWGPLWFLTSGANTNMTLSHADGLWMLPGFNRVSGSNTGTVGRVTGLVMGGGVGSAGWTINDWLGLLMTNPTNSGTITDLGAVDVEDLTSGAGAGQTFALRSAITAGTHKHFLLDTGGAQSKIVGKMRLGDTTAPTEQLEVLGNQLLTGILYGGTGSGDDLRLTSTSHATLGDIELDGPVLLYPSNPDFTAGTAETRNLLRFTDSYSSSPNAGIGHSIIGYSLAPTITSAATGADLRGTTFMGIDYNPTASMTGNLLAYGFRGRGSYTNTAGPDLLGGYRLFFADPVLVSATADIAPYPGEIVGAAPVYRHTAGSGTATLATIYTLHDATTVDNDGAATFNVTNLTSHRFVPTVREDGGTVNVTTMRMLHALAATVAGSPTIATYNALEIDDLDTATVTTAHSVVSKGATVTMLHAGAAMFGGGGTTEPSAHLHVQEQTVGNEVARFESVATNDDPQMRVYQYRATTAGAVTNSVLGTYTTTSDKVVLAEVRVAARCTASCGTVGTGAAGTIIGKFRNIGGTLTRIGTDATPAALEEDTDGTVAINLNATGASLQVRATTTGDADIALVWHVTVLVQEVGT